ncbi:MAG: PAS domain S-box protein [Candidatus Zixiibacteriota bacterium]|nr:MAG: PAS domain S-box protein [candidate division Zixibacteria bacterium]
MLPPEEIRALLQGTIDAIEDAIKIISPEHQVLFVNRTAESRYGKSCEEAAGKLCYSELGGRGVPCSHCSLRLVVETGRPQQVEFTATDAEGQRREYEQFHYPLRNGNDELLGVVEITRDITERRTFERQLQHSEKLAVVGRLSAAVAHEIRNPLTGIRLGIDALLEETTEPQQRENLEAVIQDVRRLDRVLTQLLDYTRRKESLRDRLRVPELIERVLFFIRKQARLQGVQIETTLEADLPEVQASADQLMQVLLNIFLNALQAMPQGGALRIRADRRTREARAGVLITVQDTGDGIPEEYRTRLFETFFSTKSAGSGMGLAVSNKIIADHGGAIWVESSPGAGAQVHIFLPLDPQDSPDEVEHPAG